MCTEESKQGDKPAHLHKFTMIPLWRVCEESWKLQRMSTMNTCVFI